MKSAGNSREVGRPCTCSSFFIHATKLRNNLGLHKLFGNYFHSSDEVFPRVGETQKRGKEESRHLMFPRGQEEAEDGLFLVKVYYYILTIIIRGTVTIILFYSFSSSHPTSLLFVTMPSTGLITSCLSNTLTTAESLKSEKKLSPIANCCRRLKSPKT